MTNHPPLWSLHWNYPLCTHTLDRENKKQAAVETWINWHHDKMYNSALRKEIQHNLLKNFCILFCPIWFFVFCSLFLHAWLGTKCVHNWERLVHWNLNRIKNRSCYFSIAVNHFQFLNRESLDLFYAKNGLKRRCCWFYNHNFDRPRWLNQQLKIITEKQAIGWDGAIYQK